MRAIEKAERPAFLNPDNSYDLLVPVTYQVGDETVTLSSLQLRRLTGVELLIIDKAPFWSEKLLQILESMTGHMRVVTKKLDAVDLDRIDDILGYFREPGSVTGAIS